MLNELLEELLQNRDVYSYRDGKYFLLHDMNQEETKAKIYIDEEGDIIIEEEI